MHDETTINISPDPSYIKKSFEHFGIELGGALQMTPTGDFRIDSEAPDYASVLGALTGQLLADYASGTMVLPSNVKALQDVERTLKGVLGTRMTPEARLEVDEAIERLQGVITNLDGLLGPVAS